MKPIAMIGVILIVIGILTLGYQGFSYKKQEKVAQIGSMQITNEKEKTVYFPHYLGGITLIVGIALVAMGKMGE